MNCITLPSLKEFIEYAEPHLKRGFPTNSYIKEPGFSAIYVRFTRRYIGGAIVDPVFDLANITVEESLRGQGIFTSLIYRICREWPYINIYVENTHERFGKYLLSQGFAPVEHSSHSPLSRSYFLKASAAPHSQL